MENNSSYDRCSSSWNKICKRIRFSNCISVRLRYNFNRYYKGYCREIFSDN